jgi:hypothetical protein
MREGGKRHLAGGMEDRERRWRSRRAAAGGRGTAGAVEQRTGISNMKRQGVYFEINLTRSARIVCYFLLFCFCYEPDPWARPVRSMCACSHGDFVKGASCAAHFGAGGWRRARVVATGLHVLSFHK